MSFSKPSTCRIVCWTILATALGSSSFAQRETNERQVAKPSAPTENQANNKNDEQDRLFKGMTYRLIGPFRGGRSLTAAGIPGDPKTYYFGATGGGVWKSTDAATTWHPVFDKEPVSAIGSIAVAPSDPNTVYVGTGEACIRSDISHGDGIYKTVDGGPHNSHILFAALWEARRTPWGLSSGGPGTRPGRTSV